MTIYINTTAALAWRVMSLFASDSDWSEAHRDKSCYGDEQTASKLPVAIQLVFQQTQRQQHH
jgi:hypothetical protein